MNPLGGVTQTSYNTAGSKYCTVTPNDYATGTTCHALPLTIPTQGHDTYLGETITTFNAQGQAIQRTDALGNITLTTYDGAGNVTKTVKESKTATVASVTTTTLYDTDNRPYEATTGTGSTAAATRPLPIPTATCTVRSRPTWWPKAPRTSNAPVGVPLGWPRRRARSGCTSVRRAPLRPTQ